jgi:hypothetical protein
MNTRNVCDQWFEMNRAALEPLMRWNEVALQTAERMAGNRQVYEQWFDLNRAALDPLVRWGDIALQAAEKVARCNLTLAQDYLDLGARQTDLLSEVRDPQKWKDEENRLVSEFTQRWVDHTGDFLQVARETRDAYTDWANRTARETAERAARAADTAAKAAADTAQAAGEGARAAAGAGGPGAPRPQPQPGQREPQRA